MTRRFIVIHLKRMVTQNDLSLPDNYEDKERVCFIHRCVLTRRRLGLPPITIEMFLETLFGSNVQHVTRAMRLKAGSTHLLALVASHSIALLCNLTIERLIHLAEAMSLSLVFSDNGVKALRDVEIIFPYWETRN
jgi:hypothetical protein